MAINRGKSFEEKVKNDWIRTVPDSFILRLPDQVSQYHGTSSNISDFIAFAKRSLWLIECKSIHGNTFPLVNLRQYEKLVSYKDTKHVYPGILLWWVDHQKVAWVPIDSIQKMKKDDKKSINIKMLNSDEYKLVEIPSVPKRVFLDSDYSALLKLVEE